MRKRRARTRTTLAELRTAAGLTQPQLSKKSGISRSTIAHMEADPRWPAKLATLRALALALGVSLLDLLSHPSDLVQPRAAQ